eukprot:312105_1
MSAEISETEKYKGEIYQLRFAILKCTCAFISIAHSSFKKQTIHRNINNEMPIDKMEEMEIFAQTVTNLSSYWTTTAQTLLTEFDTKHIQSVNASKKDAKKALKCLIFGYIKQETENKYNLMIPF